MHFLAQYGNVKMYLVSNFRAFIKKDEIGLKRAPQCPFGKRGRGMQFFYTGYMAWCKAHNTYMGIYVQGAAEYHRGMQFFLYNMHLALHIRYVQDAAGNLRGMQFF